MAERSDGKALRERRMSEPGADAAYRAARLAFELGHSPCAARTMWLGQGELARLAGMTQSAVARFEAGGTVPTLPVWERLAGALDAELVVQVTPRPQVA